MAKHRKPVDLAMGAGRHSRIWLLHFEKPATPGYVCKHERTGKRDRKVLVMQPVR